MANTPPYKTVDDEPLPDSVIKQIAPPDDWVKVNPQQIPRPVISGGYKLYDVYTYERGELTRVFMDDSGHAYGEYDYYSAVGDTPESMFYALDPSITHVHSDTRVEHLTKVILAKPEGVFKHVSRGGVAWVDITGDLDASDLTASELDLVESLADGPDEHLPDRPKGWESITDSAWHSTMEGSSLSERINSITGGEAHRKQGWSFPVVVRFGDTKNVCSQPFTLYAPSMHRDALIRSLADAHGIGRRGLKNPHGGVSSTAGSVMD